MSLPADQPATDAPDGVEEGRRLVRVGGEGGLSLADRLAERLHRLAWRTPLHAARLKGRYPLKLIAVPDDPFAGDIRRGAALLAGELRFRGETHAIEGLDLRTLETSRAFADHLHGFGWLRDLSTVATRAQGALIAEDLMARWLHAFEERVSGDAWRADLWGRRVLAWTCHAPLILSSTDLIYRSKVLNALARGARHLDRTADKAPAGPPRIAAWCGVIAAGLLIPGGDGRRAFGEAGLARALATGVFADGGTVGRSPAELLDAVALLAVLRQVYAARRMELLDTAAAALARMAPALLGVTLGDRALGSWQGGAPVAAARVAEVLAAANLRTRPLRQSRDWGYQRLAAAGLTAVMDAAPPPVARVIRHGCASTLAFELSDGEARLVVNCGGAGATAAGLAEALRTTAAHSTLTLADTNSTALGGDGTLGRGVSEVELSRQESEGASRIEASHDGYVRRHGFLHRRQLLLTGDGRELRGDDQLLPRGRRQAARTPFAVRFHLGRGVEAAPTADGQAALLRLAGGGMWQFRARGGALAVEDSVWIDADGRALPTRQLVVTGEAEAGGAAVAWVFKRAG